MKRFIYILAAFALMGAVSCQPDEEVAVHASFTTDKESYDVGDPVVLTNTSTAENALIAICKWELGKGVVSYETTPENISYDQSGEYVIKLTVTSDRGAKKSSFEKTIRVVDNNIRPVADFTWSPEKVVAGEPVQFTDRSTDEDGETVVERGERVEIVKTRPRLADVTRAAELVGKYHGIFGERLEGSIALPLIICGEDELK